MGRIPDETVAPFPGDGSNGADVLEQSGIVRRDIRSSFAGSRGTAEGVPMKIELVIRDLAGDGAPFSGVAVYVEYQNYLRGVQIADADGRGASPASSLACHSGRWPHIHFEVYPDRSSIPYASSVIGTSQVALPKKVCDWVYAQDGYESSAQNLVQVQLDTHGVFGDDGGNSQLATVTGDVAKGYSLALEVGVDTKTTPTGGTGGSCGAPGGPPPGGPPPASL